ncbi:type II toxin-antitoxin system VapC family toxin [Sphingomonas sp. AR_OL41]|uniref:type II toxin-antitoxin system VapC family toxin n=1 Tax=Sphingomonas sp. AR_OL41 TaxID=3042729 RepID=UPI002480F0C0|nr:type II toxin-antitoxin system VapC family toxin [Sphingomonas sp. AR_OL41]MDH7973137.1 type II toxin-antitoxin system VapC family toxin [Sphingomonas sp. AR_OL41]
MSGYLLDTNIISDLVRNPAGRVARKIAEVGEDAVATSVIVAAELRFGAAKKGSSALSARIDAILGALPVLPLEPPADAAYGDLRAKLEQSGTPIGANDMLIAAHSLGLGRTLVTANVAEFARVADLVVVNWLE